MWSFRRKPLIEEEELARCKDFSLAIDYLRAKEAYPNLTLKEFKRNPREYLPIPVDIGFIVGGLVNIIIGSIVASSLDEVESEIEAKD